MRGPIDFIVVQFPGNKFKGDILPEIQAQITAGTIALLDLALIMKDDKDEVVAIELSQSKDPAIAEFAKANSTSGGLITQEDIDEISELLEPNSSAGLLIIEHLWAKGLKKAIMDADGELIAEGRIHPDAAKELDK